MSLGRLAGMLCMFEGFVNSEQATTIAERDN